MKNERLAKPSQKKSMALLSQKLKIISEAKHGTGITKTVKAYQKLKHHHRHHFHEGYNNEKNMKMNVNTNEKVNMNENEFGREYLNECEEEGCRWLTQW
jgi:hypothetical protein